MPGIIRYGDLSQGHCFPPMPFAGQPSMNVFVNGIKCVRLGDDYDGAHCCCCECPDTHSLGVAMGGSATVFVNSKPIHRIGDKIECGDTGANGSENVFAGD